MQVTISNKIRLRYVPDDFRRWLTLELSMPNPEYAKKERMGFWVGNTPKTIRMYETDGADVVVPYGCLYKLFERAPDDVEIIWAGRAKNGHKDFKCEIPLYDYQVPAVEALQKKMCGILQAPAGSGKTQMGIALASRIGRRTLWLTHTLDLLKQSKKRALQYMPEELVGTIAEGRVDIGECITFATVQTMSRLDLPLYKDTWDTVICDECHRIAGTPAALTMFSKVLSNLYAPYKYGLSATVHRADGLIKATKAVIGDVVYVVPKSATHVMSVDIRRVNTGAKQSVQYLDTDGMIVHTQLISYLADYHERNQVIAQKLIESDGHSCLILSDRLAHLETLLNMLPDHIRARAAMISGKMQTKKGKEMRERYIEQMRTGELNYLFATYSLAKEGLDIPRLDRLFLATPQKDKAVMIQAVGRIARQCEGKGTPVAYDFVDEEIGYCVGAWKKRCTTYRKEGYAIVD